MNTITFPEFNLVFNISKIAISIGNIHIYWYAICIVLGIVISLILCSKSKQSYGINFEDFLEIIIFSLVFGIIGARLYYVIFRIDYYKNNLYQVFNIRDGGLAIYGGIIGGIITSYIICRKKQIDIMNFLDYSSPYLVLSQAIGRWGNFFNVEAYGTETKTFFRMGVFSQTNYIEVHPCFLYESFSCFIIFILLKLMQNKRKFKGQVFCLYLILYGMIRFLIEGIRVDSLIICNFRASQITSLIFIAMGIYLIIKQKNKTKYYNT